MKALAFLLALLAAAPTFAAEGGSAPVGYGGKKVQLLPIMAPYRTSAGIRYEVLTIRIVFDNGLKERPACFSLPVIHDRFVRYLYSAKLTPADFVGERRDVLAKNLFDVAVKAVGRGYYTSLDIADPSKDDLSPKSSAKAKETAEAESIAAGKTKPKGGKEKSEATPGEVDQTLSTQCEKSGEKK